MPKFSVHGIEFLLNLFVLKEGFINLRDSQFDFNYT